MTILSGNYSVRKIHTDISTLPEYMVMHQKAIGIPIMQCRSTDICTYHTMVITLSPFNISAKQLATVSNSSSEHTSKVFKSVKHSNAIHNLGALPSNSVTRYDQFIKSWNTFTLKSIYLQCYNVPFLYFALPFP